MCLHGVHRPAAATAEVEHGMEGGAEQMEMMEVMKLVTETMTSMLKAVEKMVKMMGVARCWS